MRTKKAVINTMTSIMAEVVSIICGLILPRLILGAFGSSYNGITSSITQFLSCIVLLRAGVGSVTRAALYVDLPTLGLPTMATIGLLILSSSIYN